MKKMIFLAGVLCAGAVGLAAQTLVSDRVISLYESATSPRVVGRLLPTNAFEVVGESGGRVQLRIAGFVNPAAPSVIYFNDNQRLMVAAFSKNHPPKLQNIVKSASGKWDAAQTLAWADKPKSAGGAAGANSNLAGAGGADGLTNGAWVAGTGEMFARAAVAYKENCGICHTAHDEREFTTNQWPATFNAMRARTGIAKDDSWLIIQYLQKHSKDIQK